MSSASDPDNTHRRAILVAARDRDLGTYLLEQLGSGKSDPTAAGCDYRNFSFKSFHDFILSFLRDVECR